MTITQVDKEIERLEIKLSELRKKLRKTQSTEVEMEISKTDAIYSFFLRIQGLLSN